MSYVLEYSEQIAPLTRPSVVHLTDCRYGFSSILRSLKAHLPFLSPRQRFTYCFNYTISHTFVKNVYRYVHLTSHDLTSYTLYIFKTSPSHYTLWSVCLQLFPHIVISLLCICPQILKYLAAIDGILRRKYRWFFFFICLWDLV